MKTILIVDDLESVRFYHRQLFEAAGFSTLTAAGGAEALRVLERNHVDLVMLDLVMPGMSGTEFLDRARTGGDRAGWRVLVVSTEPPQGSTDAQLVRHAPDEILQKPLLPGVLLASVSRLLA